MMGVLLVQKDLLGHFFVVLFAFIMNYEQIIVYLPYHTCLQYKENGTWTWYCVLCTNGPANKFIECKWFCVFIFNLVIFGGVYIGV